MTLFNVTFCWNRQFSALKDNKHMPKDKLHFSKTQFAYIENDNSKKMSLMNQE